ncbi:hypothetical protein RSK20926_11024 [Roseobacter sp. SK209-2-6]|uniref:BLUF domain-containing protein n=1 Tax=Roseobacter sp. SK209-2-6 TaxID=388739 RepID=UPI0000F3C4A6|nr:BLUF domain-containing protein [Roseobacter sp. SK209-2-6]EBA18246.1 hypothetical protein RSK20926_11024 [Roseobacter sp. SK209-2-6]
MGLSYTIYQSTALVPAEVAAHNEILRSCQTHNKKNDVTGFLHREGNYFIQYLEGPEEAIIETMLRIGKDPRHEDLLVLDLGPLQERRLPDWQMGFVDGSQLSLHELIEARPGVLNLKAEDPFDLVVFMTANAHNLREDATRVA